MKITIPELSLVVLIGPSGCGKSSFGDKQFLSTEVVSSDECRGLVSDDENDQSATGDAFDLLHTIVRKRLGRGALSGRFGCPRRQRAERRPVRVARGAHPDSLALQWLKLFGRVAHPRLQ